MAELSLGLLFKKKYIKHNKKEHEIFIFKDFVTGMAFTNTNGNEYFHVVTGNLAGAYASVLNQKGNEGEDVVIRKNIKEALEINENKVEFDVIKNKYISRTSPYYIRNNNKNGLEVLVDEKLVAACEKQFNKKTSDFDKDFEKTSDISEMYNQVRKTIISQDIQIKQILTALFKNQKIVESELDIDLIAKLKENLLIFGSTGTGKTEILKRISRLYNVPIVIEDATSLSETGYHGRNISDMLQNLVMDAEGDRLKAEKGILVIDEFDKLAEKQEDNQSHVSRIGVQRGLLKLLDGSDFYFDGKKFNTAKLTVVALGAFTDIVKDETSTRTMGFGAIHDNLVDKDNYQNITTDDFVKYGIMRELMGRFSKFVAMNPLKEEDIAKILIESNFSPLNTYKELFDMLNVEFNYNQEFINWLAAKAILLNSGARSLKTVFDECISGAMFQIFAGEYSRVSLVRPETDEEIPYILTKKQNKTGFFNKFKK